MNFQRGRGKEPLEINLVPLIDVMMVILIFLMITTTYSKYTELQISLPTADAEKQLKRANGTLKAPLVVISADAAATHQAVVRVMEASRLAGLTQLTFTTQAAK